MANGSRPPSLEAGGGSDMHLFRNVDNPDQVLATMWWDTAEHCRAWAAEHGEEAFKVLGDVTKNAENEFLWEEF